LKEIGAKIQLSSCKGSIIFSKFGKTTQVIWLAEVANKVTFFTKHIVVKYHFFCSQLNDEVEVQKVDTTEQLAGMFTKGFGTVPI